MSNRRRTLCALLTALAFLAGAAPARADASDSESTEFNSFVSGYGNWAYLTAGVALPLLTDGSKGSEHSQKALDALATSVMVAEGLKLTFREQRPDSGNRDSFPSGHTTAAFALATVQSHYHPDQAPLWYAGAALVGASRVTLHRHYVHDVLAGAVLGYVVGRSSLNHKHEVTITPGAGPDSAVFGVSVRITL